MKRLAITILVTLIGCADPADNAALPVPDQPPASGPCVVLGAADGFASCVESFAPELPASFGHDAMPEIVLGPPRPPGGGGGGMDVASLGCGGSITLGFVDAVRAGPGADLIVFENAFATGDTTFAEPASVLVSDDGQVWFAFECDATATDADGCAGVTPTAAENDQLARDPQRSGGDAFDLDELGLDRIHWVRLVDRTREHYGSDLWCGGAGAGFDLDAIARVHDP